MKLSGKHYERIGWTGFILIVSAYFLVTIKWLDVSTSVYHLMNLAGALCMVINARHKEARPLFWLNVVWAMVAVIGLMKIS